MYKKYSGTPVQMEILTKYTVNSMLMCGDECTENSDCFAFRVVDDEYGSRCDLMKEGTGTLMQDFFRPICLQ